MSVQRRRRWPSITSALGQCIVLSGVSCAEILKRHQHYAAVRRHGTITQCCFNDGPASKTVGQHETELIECHVFAQNIQETQCQISFGKALLRRRLTGIEPAMGCNADPTLNWNWVGRAVKLYNVTRRIM